MGGPANVQASINAWQYAHLSGAATTAICPASPSAVLHAITVNTGAAGTVTVYDGTVAQNKVVAVITPTAVAGPSFLYDVALVNGLTIVISAAIDITVAYQG